MVNFYISHSLKVWKSGHLIICGASLFEAEKEIRLVAVVTSSIFKILICCSLLLCHRMNLNSSQGKTIQETVININRICAKDLQLVVQNNVFICNVSCNLQDIVL